MAQLNLTQNSSLTSPSTINFMYYVAFPCMCKITRTYHKFHTVSLSRTSFTAPCLLSSHKITTNFKQVWVHSWQLSSYNTKCLLSFPTYTTTWFYEHSKQYSTIYWVEIDNMTIPMFSYHIMTNEWCLLNLYSRAWLFSHYIT